MNKMDNNKEVSQEEGKKTLLTADEIAQIALANYGNTANTSVFAFAAGFSQANAEEFYNKLLLEEVEKAWCAGMEGVELGEYLDYFKKRLNIE